MKFDTISRKSKNQEGTRTRIVAVVDLKNLGHTKSPIARFPGTEVKLKDKYAPPRA